MIEPNRPVVRGGVHYLARWLVSGLLVLALCVTGSTASRADTEPGRWVTRHYGSVDGLPVDSASSGQIDADGFLWLATHDGLARFDGQRFDVHDSMRFPAMSGNRVLSIHKNAHGQLFAYTGHGDWLSIRSGRIERVAMGGTQPSKVLHVDPASLCLTTANALHCPDDAGHLALVVPFPESVPMLAALPGHDGEIWAVTVAGDIWRHRQGGWSALWQPAGQGMASGTLVRALVADDGDLWVSSAERVVQVARDGAIRVHDQPESPREIVQIHQDRHGDIWVGSVSGMYRFDDGQLRRVFVGREPSVEPGHLIWEAPDGALWLRAGHQLWRFEDAAAIEAAAALPAPAPVLVSKGRILDLLFDTDGTVWVMTLRDGIHRLNRARVELLDADAGLGDGNIYGVSHDADGVVWLGTLGDGLKSITPDGQVHRHGREQGLPGENPWLVAAAPDGSVYVGTYAPGLWRRPAGARQFVAEPLPLELAGEQVLAVVFDGAARLWLGTSAGAWRRDAAGWQRQWPTSTRRVRVNALAFSDAGEVWFGGSEGVWRQHGDQIHAVAESVLARTSVRDLYRSSDGALWASTDGRGLIRVDARDATGERALQLGRAQGLPSNSPHTVREDAQGHLWVNSNQGIFRIAGPNLAAHLRDQSQRLSPLVLGLSDGLTELEGNGGVQPAATFDRHGRLWFPSQRGVVRFDPLAMVLRERAPRAVIDGVESEGRALAIAADGALPVGVRSLLIRYGAADLRAGSDVRFRYRLLPQDHGWTDAVNGRAAAFARLSPGDYRFELLAGNSDGIWAQSATGLDFRVPHRWHETGVFHGALAIGGLLALLLAMRLRTHSLHSRAAALDHEVGQRTQELRIEKGRVELALHDLSTAHAELARTHAQIEDRNQQLAQQAQRLESMDRFRSRVLADVSHELRTPVMLVSLPMRELHAQAGALGETERRRLQLAMAQLDRLGGLVEQLVGLVQAESGQLHLRLRRIDMSALLAEIVAGYQPAAARVGAELRLHGDDDGIVLFADREHLVTVFGNLIDNAIKYAPAGGQVQVRMERTDDAHVRITVADDGPGFDPALAAQLFERFYRSEGPPRHGREGLGIGLALARELVELHGGRIGAHSAPGAGATFQVQLPCGSAHVVLDELVLDQPVATASVPVATASEDANGRVLLVEDHPDLAAYLSERLGEYVPVTWVDSAERALLLLDDATDIRLVVSDVMLPGATGLALCRRLHAEPGRPPVILISAKAAEPDRAAGEDAGAVAYLAKPFSFEALLQAVAEAWPAAAWRLSAQPATEADADPLLRTALDALADAAFGVSHWADRVHLSERQLRRRVNELTGQSPQTWLREQRLLRVRHLVRSGQCRTLAEAGLCSGLDNPAYLYRSYRARFGEH